MCKNITQNICTEKIGRQSNCTKQECLNTAKYDIVLRNIFKIKEIPNFLRIFSRVRYGNCISQGYLKEQNL